MKFQLTTGTLLLLAGMAMMGYTVYALAEAPYACALVLGWLLFVEYVVARAWWVDVQDIRTARRVPR